MKFTDEEGKVWATIAYRLPQKGDMFIEKTSQQIQQAPWDFKSSHLIRLIVKQSLPIHKFGGVKFEETGEERCARPGEWAFIPSYDFPIYWPKSAKDNHSFISRILRPLQGE